MVKPVELRLRAAEDVDVAIGHYQREGGASLAVRFIDAFERAVGHLAQHPSSGSLRLSYELHIPDLRVWPLATFPNLVFYVDHAEHVDVWRVLHAHLDLPTWLASPDPADDDRV